MDALKDALLLGSLSGSGGREHPKEVSLKIIF